MQDKQLDQHFLKDSEVILKMIESITPEDTVLEIGPGKGAITKELAKKAKKVVAVELDESLKDSLKDLPENVEVIYGNTLGLIDDLKFNKIVANIPFSISEPLFKKLVKIDFKEAVLLIGKKFYDLLSGEDKLAVISKVFFDIEKIADVPKNAFEPEPKVESLLVKIKKRKTELNQKEQIIKKIVQQDDKLIKNALMYAFMRVKNCTKKQAREEITKLGLKEDILKENIWHLPNEEFKELIHLL
ncbi:MAG: rRNA adenine N-6-methyltransferase family protein [Candidatus Woesearchaeota archaeon]